LFEQDQTRSEVAVFLGFAQGKQEDFFRIDVRRYASFTAAS